LASRQPFSILKHITSLKPDLFLMLGDATYANHPKNNPATDLASFQQKHLDVRRSPELQDLLSGAATYATWDDHDTENNTDKTHPLLLPSRAAFKDYWPVRAAVQAKAGLFRSHRWGKLAEFFMLDGRSFRDPVKAKKPRTLLGELQKKWLLDGLFSSTAQHKFIVSPVPLLAPFENDSFFGFKKERRQILRLVQDKKLKNVTVLSADFHCAWELSDRHSKVREFIAGPLAAWPFETIKKKHVKTVKASGSFSITDGPNFGHIRIADGRATLSYYDDKGRRRYRTALG
jgi:alkaline phosphatase D